MVQPDRPDDNKIGHMRTAWRVNATDTHSEYVILNTFPRQQLLRERVSVLQLHVHCSSYA